MAMPTIMPYKRGGYRMNVSFAGKRISIYGRTEEEVEKKYVSKCYEYGLGVRVGQKTLMKDYLRGWLARRKEEIKAYTYQTYRGNIENHIIPALGEKYLQDVLPADIQRLYADKRKERKAAPAEKKKLEAAEERVRNAATPKEKAEAKEELGKIDKKLANTKPLGETSLLYMHRILSAAFNDAKKNRLILINPVESVKAPRRDKVTKTLPEVTEIRDLYQSICGKEYELAVHLAISCGLRRGEICAVEWGDVDWKKRKLHVDKAMEQTSEYGIVIGLPKEEKIRDVNIPPSLIDIMKREKKRQDLNAEIMGEAYNHCKNIVRHGDGSIYTPYALSMCINGAIRRRGIKTTLHGLRSTFVSMGYLLGADEKAITEAAGHHSVEFNRERYQSVYDSMKADLANKIDKALYAEEEEDNEEE